MTDDAAGPWDLRVQRYVIEEGKTLLGIVFEVLDDGFIVEDVTDGAVFVPKLHILRGLFERITAIGWPIVTVTLRVRFVNRIDLGSNGAVWMGEVATMTGEKPYRTIINQIRRG